MNTKSFFLILFLNSVPLYFVFLYQSDLYITIACERDFGQKWLVVPHVAICCKKLWSLLSRFLSSIHFRNYEFFLKEFIFVRSSVTIEELCSFLLAPRLRGPPKARVFWCKNMSNL